MYCQNGRDGHGQWATVVVAIHFYTGIIVQGDICPNAVQGVTYPAGIISGSLYGQGAHNVSFIFQQNVLRSEGEGHMAQ